MMGHSFKERRKKREIMIAHAALAGWRIEQWGKFEQHLRLVSPSGIFITFGARHALLDHLVETMEKELGLLPKAS